MSFKKVERDRHGVTLIELLIVIAIIVLLAGLTLPSMRALLKDQRITQTARTIQGFIDSAKARAVAQNRPVAVIFERAGVDSNNPVGLLTCSKLSIGEVFPPYEGDWEGTTGELRDTGSNPDGFFDQISVPAAQAGSVLELVALGDEIVIGDNSFRFKIIAPAPAVNGTNIEINFENPPRLSDFKNNKQYAMEGMLPASGGANYYASPSTPPSVRFKIFRKPSKTMTGTLVLPRGVCIDLEWSGSGLPLPQPEFGSGLNQNVSSIRQLFVVFEPNGTVSDIYEYQINSAGKVVAQTWPALGSIHFLLGRTDQIGIPIPLNQRATVSDRDDLKPNIEDLANRWISINTRNGNVYTSNVAAIPQGSGNLTLARSYAISAQTGTN